MPQRAVTIVKNNVEVRSFFAFFYPSSSLSGDTVVVSHGNSEDRLHSPRLGE